MPMFRFLILALPALLGCLPQALTAAVLYEPFGAAAGIQVTTDGLNFGRGVAVHDVDRDGDLDIYVSDGAGRPNRLFRNDGGFSFTEVPGAWGAADTTGNTKCAVFADYDNDGDADLYLARHAQDNKLYRNDAGLFVDVTAATLVGGNAEYSYGACWVDVDNNGLLDIFVGNRGPGAPTESNLLFLQGPAGTFTESAAAWQVNSPWMTLQPAFTDYDRDGDQDLYLANDKMQGNRFYRNDGTLFTDITATSNTGLAMDAMCVAFGDVNDDQLPDLYITNTPSGNRCLVSHPDSVFVERADTMGTTVGDVGWGACFLDADLDGDEDLFEVNMLTTPNQLFENQGVYPWNEIGAASAVDGVAESFGCAYGDLDGDGDVDLYVSNTDTCQVYRNITPSPGRWLQVTVEGTVSNRDGIGARIEIEFGGTERFREIRAGSSYLSQMMDRAYFGLGGATTVDELRVRWPSGMVDTWTNVAVDQVLHVVEGATVSVPSDPPAPITRLRVAPNPVRASALVEAHLPHPGDVRVRVIDIRGRERLRRTMTAQPSGRFAWRWSPRSTSVSSGTYWIEVRLTQPGAAPTIALGRVLVLP